MHFQDFFCFDNQAYLKAYRRLQETGQWPADFYAQMVDHGVEIGSVGSVTLYVMGHLVDRYLDQMLAQPLDLAPKKAAHYCTENRLHSMGFLSVGIGEDERWICQECGATATTQALDSELEAAMHEAATTQRQERKAKISKLLKALDLAISEDCFRYREPDTLHSIGRRVCTCCLNDIPHHSKNCLAVEITALVSALVED